MGAARIYNSDAIGNWGSVFLMGDSNLWQLKVWKGEDGSDYIYTCSDHLFYNDFGGDWFAFSFEQTLSVILSDT
jgi:hypothetical protein